MAKAIEIEYLILPNIQKIIQKFLKIGSKTALLSQIIKKRKTLKNLKNKLCARVCTKNS